MLRSVGELSAESVESSPEEEKEGYGGDLQKSKVISLE